MNYNTNVPVLLQKHTACGTIFNMLEFFWHINSIIAMKGVVVIVKRLVVILMVVASMLLLAGCGGKMSVSGGTNIIKDQAALVKIMDDFKNLGPLKGKEIMVFQDVNIMSLQSGNVVLIKVLKPGSKEDIDAYEYRGSWSGPKPVQITGKGDMSHNLIPISKLDFSKVSVMYKTMEDKMKDVEGGKVGNSFLYRFWQGKWYGTLSGEGTRGKYRAEFALDGSLTKFDKQ